MFMVETLDLPRFYNILTFLVNLYYLDFLNIFVYSTEKLLYYCDKLSFSERREFIVY